MRDTTADVQARTAEGSAPASTVAGNAGSLLPAVRSVDPLAKYLPAGADQPQILYCTLNPKDPETRFKVSRMLSPSSSSDDLLHNGAVVKLLAFLVTEASKINEDGELIQFPHIRVLCEPDYVAKFSGVVGLKSLMQLAKDFTPAEWQAGILCRVHAQKSRHGGTMLIFEAIHESSDPKKPGHSKRSAK